MRRRLVSRHRSSVFWEAGRDIGPSLLRTHILKKFGISWDLLDSVKKRHIQFDLIEHLEYLFHVHVLIVVPNPIWKWCYKLVNLINTYVLIRCLWSRLR